MQKFQEFIFTEYNFNHLTGELSLHYSLDNKINFTEKVYFDVHQLNLKKIDLDILDRACFNLHLIAGISYYKTYIPNKLIVQSGKLNESQIKFWEKLYTLGLGEFFYQNQIDFRGLVNFICHPCEGQDLKVDKSSQTSSNRIDSISGILEQQDSRFRKNDTKENRNDIAPRCLVPIGGGKDSVVTAELLKKAEIDFTLFSLGDSLPQQETAELIGKDRLIVRRKLSSNLFELNKQDAFNGHVPISAYIAFLSIVTSILYDYNYIILSNEHSANYGNIDYLGVDINHQYSKSLEFEQDFNQYVEQNISTETKYFSLLRPYYELKIAEIFSKYPKYFSEFTSCNANFKISEQKSSTKWCGYCPKCAFVFAILSPFIPKKDLVKMFGKNLFADSELKQLFLELLGKGEIKPFECVGAPEEVIVAFAMVSEKGEYKEDSIMQMFEQEVLPTINNIEELREKVFSDYLQESLLPNEFLKIIT